LIPSRKPVFGRVANAPPLPPLIAAVETPSTCPPPPPGCEVPPLPPPLLPPFPPPFPPPDAGHLEPLLLAVELNIATQTSVSLLLLALPLVAEPPVVLPETVASPD
jgi:hypothetical protein